MMILIFISNSYPDTGNLKYGQKFKIYNTAYMKLNISVYRSVYDSSNNKRSYVLHLSARISLSTDVQKISVIIYKLYISNKGDCSSILVFGVSK